MNVSVEKPELAEFVRKHVTNGCFHTPEEMVECALTRLQADFQSAGELAPEVIKAMLRADDQITRGEGLTSQDVLARLERDVFAK